MDQIKDIIDIFSGGKNVFSYLITSDQGAFASEESYMLTKLIKDKVGKMSFKEFHICRAAYDYIWFLRVWNSLDTDENNCDAYEIGDLMDAAWRKMNKEERDLANEIAKEMEE